MLLQRAKQDRELSTVAMSALQASGAVRFALVLVLALDVAQTVATSGWPEPPVDLSLSRSRKVAPADPGLKRSKSQVWFEGYKAGCMQFLQSYIPDHRDGKPLIIGVAGGSGSGKTTIKDVLVEQLKEVCHRPAPLRPQPKFLAAYKTAHTGNRLLCLLVLTRCGSNRG